MKLDVIIASNIFNEGIDVPELRSAILAAGGKCLGKEEPVLMYDGTTKKAKDVKKGDLLMGPDSLPR